MIGVQCALVILNPYFLGTQLEGIAGEFQSLSGVFVTSGMVNGHVLVFRYPFHDINHENSSFPVLSRSHPRGRLGIWWGLASMERSIKVSRTLFHDALYCASFFGRIHSVNHSELLQQLRVAIVETDDSGELRAISPFVLDHLTPNLDLAKQQRRAWRNKCILRP